MYKDVDLTQFICNNFGQIWDEKKLEWSYGSKDVHGYMHFKGIRAHRIICTAFKDREREEQTDVDHINGIKHDNRPENLRWVTKKENSNNPLTKAKMSLIRTGYKQTEEAKIKIGEYRSNTSWDEETKKKISNSHKGKILSEEHKKKIVAARTGKKHSEETKKKMSEAKLGKKYPKEEE
jgi:hypothetical protein